MSEHLNGVNTPCVCDEPHQFFCRADCRCPCGRLIDAAPALAAALRGLLDAVWDLWQAEEEWAKRGDMPQVIREPMSRVYPRMIEAKAVLRKERTP